MTYEEEIRLRHQLGRGDQRYIPERDDLDINKPIDYSAIPPACREGWIVTTGTIWCKNMLIASDGSQEPVYEYTFVVNHTTRKGFGGMLSLKKEITTFPAPCQVAYDENNPWFSELFSDDQSE